MLACGLAATLPVHCSECCSAFLNSTMWASGCAEPGLACSSDSNISSASRILPRRSRLPRHCCPQGCDRIFQPVLVQQRQTKVVRGVTVVAVFDGRAGQPEFSLLVVPRAVVCVAQVVNA